MQNLEFKIREASSSDRIEVINLFVKLQEYERTIYSRRRPGIDFAEAYYEDVLLKNTEGDKGKIYVVESNLELVGFIAFFVEEEGTSKTDLDYSFRLVYVSDLFVDENFRNKGIATKLLSIAEDFAKKEKIETMKIGVLAANVGAKHLYHKFGFVDQEIDLLKKVD